MRGTWIGAVKQICQFLQDSENKIDLFRKIDTDMCDEEIHLEEIFSVALNRTAQLAGASQAHFYVDSGKDFILCDTTASGSVPQHLARDERFLGWDPEEPGVRALTAQDIGDVGQAFRDAETLLVAPVFSLKKRLLGIVVLESKRPVEVDPFTDLTVQDFSATVAGQLSLATQFRCQQADTKLTYNIMKDFFTNELKPTRCFAILAKRLRDFLPSFGPLRIPKPPEVQILTYNQKGDYLTIRGTTGEEPDITRVSVAESICGLLVRDLDHEYFKDPGGPEYFLDDPREYPNRYKSYLGKKNGQTTKIIQTEFSIPVKFNGNLIAIVNLESEFPNVFLKPHVDIMLDVCSDLGVMLNALKIRLNRGLDQQIGVAYVIDRYLEGVAETYKHGTATPLSGAKVALDVMEKSDKSGDKKLQERIEHLRQSIDALMHFQEEFCGDIVGFSKYGKYAIKPLVEQTIRMFSPATLARNENIELTMGESEEFEVYCSLFLKQHVFNLINNALYSVGERRKEDSRPAQIILTIQLEQEPSEDQERELNRRCRLSIWDNGQGVSEQDLDKLKRFEPGTTIGKSSEEGSGYGLYAAKEYVTSLGGQIFLDSKEGKWFEVALVLPLFNPDIHKDRKILGRKGSDKQRSSSYC